MESEQVIIVGGGLAGWVSAIHLARNGIKVQLIEKKAFPFHKFCGEYLSKEVLPYLHSLGIFPQKYGAKEISRFRLSSHTGEYAETQLPLGGLAIRRYTLDNQLATLAQNLGVVLIQENEVQKIRFNEGMHCLTCKDGTVFKAPLVIGAYGKRSILDKNLNRPFFKNVSAYIGVKHYIKYDYPSDLVSLHNFKGGYCGMTRMEDDSVALCYLSRKEVLKASGSIEALEQDISTQNPYIKHIFEHGTKLLDKPIVISNISFEPKKLVQEHVLMCGDAAGMIFPLAGNGMAMSIHAAKILSELLVSFLDNRINRQELEKSYAMQWKQAFASRLAWGRRLQPFMGHKWLSSFAVSSLNLIPGILQNLIKKTHGNLLSA